MTDTSSSKMAPQASGPPRRLRVLTLCTGNSVRSQMVEAWFRLLAPERVEPYSAGVRPATKVHPLTIRAMAEVGIDISQAAPKSVELFLGQAFDFVITVCAPAAAECPSFPGPGQRLHWPLGDPAEAGVDEMAQWTAFRRIRNEAGEFVRGFLEDVAGNT